MHRNSDHSTSIDAFSLIGHLLGYDRVSTADHDAQKAESRDSQTNMLIGHHVSEIDGRMSQVRTSVKAFAEEAAGVILVSQRGTLVEF